MDILRKCRRCGKEKAITEFNFRIKIKNLRQYHCKECSRLYVREQYQKNREYYLLKTKKRNRRLRDEIRVFVWNYLSSHQCVDCGEKDPIVLEFDHIKNKSYNISTMAKNKRLDQVIEEIKKCVVRCANCHRRKTAKELGWNKKFMPL